MDVTWVSEVDGDVERWRAKSGYCYDVLYSAGVSIPDDANTVNASSNGRRTR